MMPSRDFFLCQAVLNVLHRWYPTTINLGGIKAAGEDIIPNLKAEDYWGEFFREEVIGEMRSIEDRYLFQQLADAQGRVLL